MPHYFFDTSDNEKVVTDEIGVSLPDLEHAKAQAARTLTEMAKELVRGDQRRELAILIRDDQSRPVVRTALIYEVEELS